MAEGWLLGLVNSNPTIPTQFDADTGSAVPVLNVLDLAGGTGITTSGAGNTVTIDLDSPVSVANGGTGTTTLTGVLTGNGTSAVTANAVTENALLIGGASNAVSDLGAATDGELPVGISSGAPVLLTTWMQQGNNCWFWNLSFTHSAGTLTIAGADGTALSATNPGFVVLASNATAGQMVQHKITANQTLTVSDMTGNTFGTTASTAWGDNMPLYLGFVADASDANLEPIVCRIPNLVVTSSSSSHLGDPSSATSDVQIGSFFFNDVTEANYTSKNVGMIGSLKATKNASDEWTLTALGVTDGAGKFNESTRFVMAQGQNGASANTWMKPNGGTAPVWANESYFYFIGKDGSVQISHNSSGDGGTDGAGAVSAILALPLQYSTPDSSRNSVYGIHTTRTNTSVIAINTAISATGSVDNGLVFYGNTLGLIANSNFGSGSARFLAVSANYKAYNGIN